MMGSIYARSILTICAAENDSAKLGLYSLSRTKEDGSIKARRKPWYSKIFRPLHARTPSHSLFTSSTPNPASLYSYPIDHRKTMLAHAQLLMRSAWFSRGWTFQENLFSARKLIFHDYKVHWECLCAAWHEDQDSGQDNKNLSATTIRKLADLQLREGGFEYTRWPNMFRYSRLVSIFNDRTLTFQEDALDAFAGILGVLGNTFEGGFLSGIPVFCFDAAMLWQPWNPMKRRTPTKSVPESFTLPSWSWAGWCGVLNSESLKSAGSYTTENNGNNSETSWMTRNTVTWQYSKTLTGPKKSVTALPLIQSRSHWQSVAEVDLPQGWTRRRNQSDESVYNHQSAPGQSFVYPIPIREPTSDPVPPIYASFLHGRTRRGYLHAGKTYISIASQCDVLELATASGTWAGALRLCSPRSEEGFGNESDKTHTPNMAELSPDSLKSDKFDYHNTPPGELFSPDLFGSLDYFGASSWYLANPPRPDPDTAHARRTVYPRKRHGSSPDPVLSSSNTILELVEISAGSVENKEPEKVCFDEWDRAHCPRHYGTYEFYNVLWIEWTNGVAFRKALGRVEKSVWEAESKDEIDLVLG